LWITFNSSNAEEAVDIIKQLFAHVPYQLHMKEEKFYHALLQMAFTAAGIKAQSEYSTSDGRIDLVLELPKLIYIIEVKFGKKAEEALVQIEQKKYYERFLHEKKKYYCSVFFSYANQAVLMLITQSKNYCLLINGRALSLHPGCVKCAYPCERVK
jgi:Holliday junction resolvase-like predicted endonuclease